MFVYKKNPVGIEFSFIPSNLQSCWPRDWKRSIEKAQHSTYFASSETQGHIKGARESLNGRKNVYGTKKSKERREEPLVRRRSGFWLERENLCFSGTNQKPERRQPFGTGLVRHCPQGLFSPFFTFLRATFFRSFRLSLVPTICPWVSEDGQSQITQTNCEPIKTLRDYM